MKIIVYYLALTLAADLAAVMLCLWIEQFWPAISLPIFLALYFIILWVAWIGAVRLTEPKDEVLAAVHKPAE